MSYRSVAVLAFLFASAVFAAGGPALFVRPADLRDAPASWNPADVAGSAASIEVPAAPAATEAVAESGSPEALELSRALRTRWNVEQAEHMLRAADERQLGALGQALGPNEEDFARKKLAAVDSLLKHAKAHALTGADRSAAKAYMEAGFADTLYPEQEEGAVEEDFGGRGFSKSVSVADGPDDSRFASRGFPGGDMARIRGLVEAARAKRDAAGHVHGWQGNARQAFNPFLKRIGADREIPDSGCSSWAFASIDALRADKTLSARYDTAAMYGWKLLPHFVALVWPKGSDPLRAGIYVDAWAGKTDIGTLGEWRRFYSFINVVQPDGMRECDLDDWRGDFSNAKCW